MDYATIQIDIEKDKVAQYFQKRYIRPIEAIWQIFEFLIYEKFSPIKQLAINLFKEHLVYFKENVIAKGLQKRMKSV